MTTNPIWAALVHLPSKLVTPAERLYWPYLVGSLSVALLVWWRLPQHNRPSFRHWLLPINAWRSPSIRLDLLLALTWGGLKTVLMLAFTAIPWAVSSLGAVLWLLHHLTTLFGPPTPTSIHRGAAMWLYGLLLFVSWDAARFSLHRLMHRSRWLWGFHQVHHSATVLTPLTLHRSHPVETLLFAVVQWLVTVVITTLVTRLAGAALSPLHIIGVNAFGFILSFFGANLRHSHAPIAYPPWLERLLLSPAQHQLHHSVELTSQQHNYGIWLSCWDRLAGTLEHGHVDQHVTFGLHRDALNHDPRRLLSALWGPLRSLLLGRIGRPQRSVETGDARRDGSRRDGSRRDGSRRDVR